MSIEKLMKQLNLIITERNICNQHKFKKEKIDWFKKSEEFNNIIENMVEIPI